MDQVRKNCDNVCASVVLKLDLLGFALCHLVYCISYIMVSQAHQPFKPLKLLQACKQPWRHEIGCTHYT